jgi:hypothetical protein
MTRSVTLALCLCAFLAFASAGNYVQLLSPVSLSVSAKSAFFDHTANVMFVGTSNGVSKLNSTSFAALDTSGNIGTSDGRVRTELYSSDWLFVWSSSTLYRLTASNLTDVASVDLSAQFPSSIASVVVDAQRQLAYAVSYYSTALVVVDVSSMQVMHTYNFTTQLNVRGETGAYALAYDSSRKVVWIGADCPYGIPSNVWQIDVATAASPKLIRTIPFGGDTCFYADPLVDPSDSGIVYFSDDDTNNVYGIGPDGSWGPERFLPLPVYSDYGAVDVQRKQGFYVTSSWNSIPAQVFRFCFNDRPISYEMTNVTSTYIDGVSYDQVDQVLYVFSNSATVQRLYVNGTDCPQEPSSANTAVSAWWFLFSRLVELI